MSNASENRETQAAKGLNDVPQNAEDSPEDQKPPAESGLRARLQALLHSLQPRQATKADLTKDRTRSLALLIGGTVGAVLLFIGVFSTSPRSPQQESAVRNAPNLGRPALGNVSKPVQGSVTPLLNADVQSTGGASDQLSPADIRDTSRRSSDANEGDTDGQSTNVNVSAVPRRRTGNTERENSISSDRSDPLVSYRVNPSASTPTYNYGGASAPTSAIPVPGTFSYGGLTSASAAGGPITASSAKPSIVFVRASVSSGAQPSTRQTSLTAVSRAALLLQPGTRLVARLEVAATTAVKTPVVASIEYNYEREGLVILAAGTKVIGEVQQASKEGYMSLHFHTLQMPDGRQEKIEGAGVGLDQKPLKGDVSGKNTGKKILSRTLSGAGTIAAYVVGGGGGLNDTITGQTLLRDRVAGNIALAGEQELQNAAYSQNINVTVPANTRFYVVLQKAAVETTAPAVPAAAGPAAQSAPIPTAQELHELMELRQEINRMYQQSSGVVRPQD
jgi:hypothetical protein